MITYKDVTENQEVKVYILKADETMTAMAYTEHGFAHAARTATSARKMMLDLNFDERSAELAAIAGYLHDIGNMVNRINHAQSGAMLAFRILDRLGMPAEELATIVSAIGNHDEHSAFPVNAMAAAVILADKSDVRRSRVRDKNNLGIDIHDRVNYAVKDAALTTDTANQMIKLSATIDTSISPVSDYFEIFLDRMLLCRKASQFFNMHFALEINNSRLM